MKYSAYYTSLIKSINSKSELAKSIGLYTINGLGEVILLIYDQYFNGHNNYHKRIEKEILNYDKLLLNPLLVSTFGSGITGLGMFFNFFNEERLLNTDTEFLLTEIDDFSLAEGVKLLNNNEHDFIHGGVGHAIYTALRTPFKNSKKDLEKLVYALKKQAKTDTNGNYYWVEMIEGKERINLSLSHGHASKIVFFSKIIELEIDVEDVNLLLEKSVKFILTTKNTNNCGSVFPNYLEDGKGNEIARLAWCYGDLGIGIALWQAGEALKNENIKLEALKIFDATLKRIKNEDTKLQDAGICHGTAGVALVYNRIFKYTKHQKYRDAALFWCKQTITFLDNNNGLTNYKSLVKEEWYADNSLLTGSSGIALALISILSDKDYNWDRAFLLC